MALRYRKLSAAELDADAVVTSADVLDARQTFPGDAARGGPRDRGQPRARRLLDAKDAKPDDLVNTPPPRSR